MANIIIKPYASAGSASNSPLLQNPMFRLSMSSLELFHSNFLACLFQEDPIAFLKCFGVTPSNYAPQDLTLYREYGLGTLDDGQFKEFENNLKSTNTIISPEDQKKKHVTDIAVCVKNGKVEIPLLIIENKIKSYPQRKQLLGQAIRIDGLTKNCEKVILSIFPVQKEIFDGTGFVEVGYSKLVNDIRQFYQLNNNNCFNMYVNDYCNMIDELYLCLKNYIQVPNNLAGKKFLFPLHFKELEEIAFLDIYRKYQASMLYYEGLNCLKNINGGGHALSNKHAITSFNVKLSGVGQNDLYAIIQIENNQFRIAFQGDPIKKLLVNHKSRQINLPPAITNVWNYWFGADVKGNSQKKLQNGLKNEFCSYSDDFVYRYVEIFKKKQLVSINKSVKPHSNITFEQIIKTGFGTKSSLSVENVVQYLLANASTIVNNLP